MPKSKEPNVFETPYKVDVRPFLVKKGKYDYLPWAVAIRLLMEHYPNAMWCNRSHEREIRLDSGIVKTAFPYFYDPVIGGLAVETEVVIDGLVKCETLPVIDYKNNIVKNPDWMSINTALKRCLVKNISLFGLGLKVYEGIQNCEEDYTYGESTSNNATPVAPSKAEKEKTDLIETAKEIVERTLIFHQEDGEPYSALSCPVHAACTEELFRRDRIDYGTLMKMEMKAAQIGRTKRKKRVKKRR